MSRRPRILTTLCMFGLLVACGGDDDASTGSTGTSTGPDTSATAGSSGTTASDTSATGSGTSSSGSSETAGSAGTTGGAGGCGTPLEPGAVTETLTVEGKERTFLFVVPDGYDPNTPMPVVFAWHARGTTAELARLYYKVEESAAGAALFVYPQGLPQPDFGNDTGWNLDTNGEDVAFFDAMLDFVRERACVDESRIFSTGHSFGAFMSNTLGCARAGTVRALGAVAGGGPYFGCTGPVAAWIAHGMSDTTVPFSQGEGSRDFWVGENGCSDTTVPLDDPSLCVEYQDCMRGFPVVFCPHDEPDLGGHGWPAWAGPAIWDFFARF
ncbi:MAG: Ricin and poly(3-hydroxybutyrate) depolymerase fusion [Deltaproteobacteria bacterium]|nr:MAG: Ricin and poly(3-hydroxybutyrate) depolymerase fusion [Deltaproteobacteria bacterium]